MKTLNSIATLAVAAILAVGTANAQRPNQKPDQQKGPQKQENRKEITVEERAQKFVERLNKKVELTEKQQNELYAQNLEFLKKQEELRNEMKKARENNKAATVDILTKEQLAKLVDLNQNQRMRRGKGGEGRGEMRGQKGGKGRPEMRGEGEGRGQEHGEGRGEECAQGKRKPQPKGRKATSEQDGQE